MDSARPKPFLLQGLLLDRVTIAQAVDTLITWSEGADLKLLSTPNANFLRLAQNDAELRQSVLLSNLSTIDGMPLVALARLLGVQVPERVAGSDLVVALDQRLQEEGRMLRVFFFGGRDGASQAAHENWRLKDSGLVSCGWLNPGFGSVEDMSQDRLIAQINDAQPDFVIVALGAQKGQRWIVRNKNQLNARIVSHLGAVVDFVAGGIKRSPPWIGKAGLEWLWRIKEEPSLWRRYASDAKALLQGGFSIMRHRQPVPTLAGKKCTIDTALESNERLSLFLKGKFDAGSEEAWDNAISWITRQPVTNTIAQIHLDCAEITSLDVTGQGIALRAFSQLDGRFAAIRLKNTPQMLAASLERNKFLDCLSLYQSDASIR